MNTTPPDAEPGFEPHKVRSITDVKRSSDDRMVAGVCAGIAKHLNIDPVIVRVILAALIFVGSAGVIIYLAGWFLLPADNEDKSVAAQWFKLDENEEKFRTVGLIVAGVFAVTAVTGIFGNTWGASFPWFGLLLLAAAYFWIVKPRRRRKEIAPHTFTATPGADGEKVTQQVITEPKTPWSPALTIVTLSSALIAIGVLALYANSHDALPWTTYAMATLGVIAVGLLVGTVFGHAGLLIPVGGLIAVGLAVSALLPSARIGDNRYEPTTASDMTSTYRHGIGRVALDLTQIEDPSSLIGRTITVNAGIGQTRILVPNSLDVSVDAYLRVGDIQVFDRESNGTVARLAYPSAAAHHLTLRIIQSVGQIQVVKQ